MIRGYPIFRSIGNALESPQFSMFDSRLMRISSAAHYQIDQIDRGDVSIEEVNRLESSDPNLFHRRIIGRLREGNKRAKRAIRKEGSW